MNDEMRERVRSILFEMNPWWRTGKVSEYVDALKPRSDMLDTLSSVRADLVTSITGPRQVGKTTMMLQCISALIRQDGIEPDRIMYVDCDREYLFTGLERPLDDIIDIYSTTVLGKEAAAAPGRVWVFLDEVCGLPAWESVVKGWHDRRSSVKFVISDSSMTTLGRGMAKTLTGRVWIQYAPALGLAEWMHVGGRAVPMKEIEGLRSRLTKGLVALERDKVIEAIRSAHSLLFEKRTEIEAALGEYIVWGGYPGLGDLDEYQRKKRLQDIAGLTLFRDVIEVYAVRDTGLLQTLAAVLSEQTAGILNEVKVSQVLGRDRWTIAKHIDHLVDAGVFMLSPQYTGSHRASARKEKKIHASIPGLANALAMTFDPSSFERGGRPSRMLESAVAMHIARLESRTSGMGIRPPRFWRHRGAEVDVIAEFAGVPLPIEVKTGGGKGRRAGKGVEAFMEEWGCPLGLVAHGGELDIEQPVPRVPHWLLMMLC